MARLFPSPSQVRKEQPLIDLLAKRFDLHPAVAIAIQAIADDYERTFEDICEAPTVDEVRLVQDAVGEYVRCGDLAKEELGVYKWGKGSLRLPEAA